MSTQGLNQRAVHNEYAKERQRLHRAGKLGRKYNSGFDRSKEIAELEAMEEQLGFSDGKTIRFPGEKVPNRGAIGPTHGWAAPGRNDILKAEGKTA